MSLIDAFKKLQTFPLITKQDCQAIQKRYVDQQRAKRLRLAVDEAEAPLDINHSLTSAFVDITTDTPDTFFVLYLADRQ